MRRSRTRKTRRIDLDMKDLFSIVESTRKGPLPDDQRETLTLGLRALAKAAGLDDSPRSSEKTGSVLDPDGDGEEPPEPAGPTDPADNDPADNDPAGNAPPDCGNTSNCKTKTKKKRGHGRNGAEAYPNAKRIGVPHESLKHGVDCPGCRKGHLHTLAEPSILVRITGQAPLEATVYQRERLRCGLCGEVFAAASPLGVGEEKYDAKAAAMIGLLRYGSGLPFNRLAGLQGMLEIPLPASTQWDIVKEAAKKLEPVIKELVRQAADGEVVHNDDTGMRVLGLNGPQARDDAGVPPDRTGTFTSGIVSTKGARRIALYFTGWKHAGENLAAVLSHRDKDLSPPIQMCDALSRNQPKDFESILASCLAHARRYFVKTVDSFPEESRYVLMALRDVFHNDAICRERSLSKEDRLHFHQAESQPTMDGLKKWLDAQFDEKLVEPNSSLGDAIRYLRNHWDKFTLFLRKAAAPLDNNICERALKKAILHRKNSLFYKTTKGASVGDTFQSLIHTAELTKVNPLEYLATLLDHAGELADQPDRWMPWNYKNVVEQDATANGSLGSW